MTKASTTRERRRRAARQLGFVALPKQLCYATPETLAEITPELQHCKAKIDARVADRFGEDEG